MATFKCLIRSTDRKKDGTWNVKIRVTHNRQTRYISTPFYVNDSQITRGYKIKDQLIIEKVEDRIKELREAAVKIGFLAEGISVDHFVELIQRRVTNLDFFEFTERHFAGLEKEGRGHTAKARRVAVNSFRKFIKKDRLSFQEIDSNLMLRYFESIKNELKPKTVETYILALKCIYKDAQRIYNDEENNIIQVKYGVFKKIVLPDNIESDSRAFDEPAQMQALIDVPYSGVWGFDFTKDMFVLSFICFGINPIDLFFAKKDQVQDGVFIYRRSKIKRRKKKIAEQRVKLSEVAKIIFAKYSGDPEFLIDFQGHSRRASCVVYIHGSLQDAGLESFDPFTRAGHGKGDYVFYTARHSMATFARNVCGIPWDVVNDMLGHTPRNNTKMTDTYIKTDWTVRWKANEKLLGLFDWTFYLNQANPPYPSYLE